MKLFKRRKEKFKFKAKPAEKDRMFRKLQFRVRAHHGPRPAKQHQEIKKQEIRVVVPEAKKEEPKKTAQEVKEETHKPVQAVFKKIQEIEEPLLRPKPSSSYMRRNVNFSLFFLIIIILGALAGLTSYYQTTYTQQANVLKQKTQEFNTALNELNIKRTILNETSVKLDVETKSKEQLGGLYTSIKQEKEAVEADLQKKRDELTSTLALLEITKDTLVVAEKEREDALRDVERYKEEADEWKNIADSRQDELRGCQEELATCQAGP